jgi:hypothetical protein
MALLSPQQVGITGTAPTYANASGGGDTVVPDDRAFLIVKNTSGSPVNVTVVVPGSVYGQPRADVVVSVPATTGERWIGPLVADLADPADGLIDITYSAVANVTVAVARV